MAKAVANKIGALKFLTAPGDYPPVPSVRWRVMMLFCDMRSVWLWRTCWRMETRKASA